MSAPAPGQAVSVDGLATGSAAASSRHGQRRLTWRHMCLCCACCAASYFLAGATMTGGTITVEGCGSDSLQVRAWAASGGWL